MAASQVNPLAGRRVIVRARTYGGEYSGGRLHAWVLAEGFAAAGCEVLFWGDRRPDFVRDFAGYPGHARIQWHEGQAAPAWDRCDLFVVVPHSGRPLAYYPHALGHARRLGARVVLLNFETPNWFNALSPEPRDPRLWDGWCEIARHADAILSSSDEGMSYAREFYREAPAGCQFLRLHPAINSLVADRVVAEKTDQIICITRLSNRHKGAADILAIVSEAFRGYTLALVVGAGGIPAEFESLLRERCAAAGMHVKLLRAISDEEKFQEIKRSRVMVFPSYFEGFGYPPVESLYCGTPCVAYDLPVLKEVSGSAVDLVTAGDRPALAARVRQVLDQNHHGAVLQEQVAPYVSFPTFVSLLSTVSGPLMAAPARRESRAAHGAKSLVWTWTDFLDRSWRRVRQRLKLLRSSSS